MLVFNEGVPRSGKSYDCVLNHIVPALASGRTVYARLNGMDDPACRQAIADYLKMDKATLDERLIHVSSAEVRTMFLAESVDGEWRIPDALKDNLCVVDECHQFYVADRNAINPAIEEFMALIGQNGGDVVLMSQWFRRLHSSVRARIERKNLFQKLTAVGMEKKYTVTRYHALAPERFEKISTDTCSYLPAIFPMYKGYADGSENKVVYKGGGKTVWAKIASYAVFVVPLVLVALYVFMHFFGPNSGLAKAPQHVPVHRIGGATGAPSLDASAVMAVSHPMAPKHLHGKLTEGQAYIWELADKARPRLAGVIQVPGALPVGVIEWRQDQASAVSDRLSLAQIRDLGVDVELHDYGVRLVAGKDSMIVTAWPLDQPDPAATTSQPAQPVVASVVALPSSRQSGTVAAGTPWPSGVGAQAYIAPAEPGHWDPTPIPGGSGR